MEEMTYKKKERWKHLVKLGRKTEIQEERLPKKERLFKKSSQSCKKDRNIERKPSEKDRNIEFELQGVLGKTGPASDPPTQTRPEILFQFDGGTVATSRQYKWPMGLKLPLHFGSRLCGELQSVPSFHRSNRQKTQTSKW